MKKSTMDILLTSALLHKNDYDGYFIDDEKVSECIMDMYFYMLYGLDNIEKKEEYFHEFENKYNKLNKEQQELVKQEYIDIIEKQNKNKEKMKRKER